jgi:4-diphosphocytidyl-2-C-methyl-D-erythritol kinase
MRHTLLACAKVNLTLEVLGRRADGFHEIASVVQIVSLADMLSFEPDDTVKLSCNIQELCTPDNLVVRAVEVLRAATGCKKGARIELTKVIPVAAGLGSGATDAAATLIGLNTLWQLGLPLGKLAELGGDLGSDVPFFLCGGTAVARGRGEVVTPLRSAPRLWMVLLTPAVGPVPGKTGQMYARVKESHFTGGEHTNRLIGQLGEGRSVGRSLLYNVFDEVAFDFFQGLPECRERFARAGARYVHVAGAGPTLFSPVENEAQGRAIVRKLEADGQVAYLVHTPAPVESGNHQC